LTSTTLSLAVVASADVQLVIRSAALLKQLLIDFHEIMRGACNVMLPGIVDLILEVNRERVHESFLRMPVSTGTTLC